MTLHDLLGIARHMLNADREEMRDLGEGIIAMLGESQPCGWPEPVVDRGLHDENGHAGITWNASPIGETMMPHEARSIAVMLLRAADEAEAP